MPPAVFRHVPLWAVRLITAAAPLLVAVLAAGAVNLATDFGARSDAFDSAFWTTGYLGLAAASGAAASVVVVLSPVPRRRRLVEATTWAVIAAPIFSAAYLALATVTLLGGYIYHHGFD